MGSGKPTKSTSSQYIAVVTLMPKAMRVYRVIVHSGRVGWSQLLWEWPETLLMCFFESYLTTP